MRRDQRSIGDLLHGENWKMPAQFFYSCTYNIIATRLTYREIYIGTHTNSFTCYSICQVTLVVCTFSHTFYFWFNLCVICETFSMKVVFKWSKQLEITRDKIRIVSCKEGVPVIVISFSQFWLYVTRNVCGGSLPWWDSIHLISRFLRFLWIALRNFNRTLQCDAAFTFSPFFWNLVNNTAWDFWLWA